MYVGTFGQPTSYEYSVKYRTSAAYVENIPAQHILYIDLLLPFQVPLFSLHEYKGTSNKVIKAWNDCLIYFVPLLCSLEESSAQSTCAKSFWMNKKACCSIRKIWSKFKRFALTLTKSIPLLVMYAVASNCSIFPTRTLL